MDGTDKLLAIVAVSLSLAGAVVAVAVSAAASATAREAIKAGLCQDANGYWVKCPQSESEAS